LRQAFDEKALSEDNNRKMVETEGKISDFLMILTINDEFKHLSSLINTMA